jgi:hypothetical protein
MGFDSFAFVKLFITEGGRGGSRVLEFVEFDHTKLIIVTAMAIGSYKKVK